MLMYRRYGPIQIHEHDIEDGVKVLGYTLNLCSPNFVIENYDAGD